MLSLSQDETATWQKWDEMLEYLSLLLLSYQNVILGKQPVLALTNMISSRGCTRTAKVPFSFFITLEFMATES